MAGGPTRDTSLSVEQRFWSKVTKNVSASRFSLEIKLGRKIKTAFCALHHCDNPPCVNPKHLFEGTYSDNSKDAAAKGRLALQQKGLIDRPRGEDHHHSKLTAEMVLSIRQLYRSGLTQKRIATQFGITQPSVGYIVRREQWAHVP